jgi:hypothetical protein
MRLGTIAVGVHYRVLGIKLNSYAREMMKKVSEIVKRNVKKISENGKIINVLSSKKQ